MSYFAEADMKRVICALCVMALSGCVTLPTAPSVPMAPAKGKPFDLYLEDDGTCRQLAERQLGRYYDYFSTQEAQYHYDTAYVNCMLSRGNVALPPVVHRWYRIEAPPQGYYDPPPEYNPEPIPDDPPPPE